MRSVATAPLAPETLAALLPLVKAIRTGAISTEEGTTVLFALLGEIEDATAGRDDTAEALGRLFQAVRGGMANSVTHALLETGRLAPEIRHLEATRGELAYPGVQEAGVALRAAAGL